LLLLPIMNVSMRALCCWTMLMMTKWCSRPQWLEGVLVDARRPLFWKSQCMQLPLVTKTHNTPRCTASKKAPEDGAPPFTSNGLADRIFKINSAVRTTDVCPIVCGRGEPRIRGNGIANCDESGDFVSFFHNSDCSTVSLRGFGCLSRQNTSAPSHFHQMIT
jgi:hypothetical protein